MRWEERVASAVVRRRVPILVLVALVTLGAGILASRVTFDSSIEVWFVEGDPTLESYKSYLDLFEGDEIAVVAVFAGDVFSPAAMETIDRLTRAGAEVPYVRRARSLTNARVVMGEGDVIRVAPLVDRLPTDQASAARIRERALANPLVADVLVAKDGKAAGVVLEIAEEGNTFDAKIEITARLKEIVAKEKREGIGLVLAGTPPLDAAFYEYSKRDSERIVPLTLVMVFALSFLLFRRFSAALIPLLVVGLASLWCLGLMGALGLKMTVLTSALVAFLVAVGVADGIHVVAEYYRLLAGGRTPEDAVRETIATLLVPCFYTSTTTAAGLLSLLTADVGPVREFGWLAAVGVGIAFFLTTAGVPALLRLARPPDPAFLARQRGGRVARLLLRLARPGRGRSLAVLAASLVLMVASAWPISRIRVGPNPMNYFPDDAPIRADIERFEGALGGSTSLEFLVHAPDEGLEDPEVLGRLQRFQRWIEGIPEITRCFSVVDLLEEVNAVFQGRRDASGRGELPGSREQAAQSYLVLEGEEDLAAFVQDGASTGRISARVKLSEAGSLIRRVPEIMGRIERDFAGPELRLEVTGFINLMKNFEVYLLEDQVQSILLAFATIVPMMALLLRSVKLGLFAMIPNLPPLVFGLAFMGVAGIHLDPGTVMIGSIALGLVVDDTIHFLVRLKRQLAQGGTLEEGLGATIEEAGQPIVLTGLLLAGGFGILVAGSFTPNIHFGVVSAWIILVSVVGELLLLPAALVVLRPRLTGRRGNGDEVA